MKVLILMPEYCAVVDLNDGDEEFQILILPTEIPPVSSILIREVVKEILMRLGIY